MTCGSDGLYPEHERDSWRWAIRTRGSGSYDLQPLAFSAMDWPWSRSEERWASHTDFCPTICLSRSPRWRYLLSQLRFGTATSSPAFSQRCSHRLSAAISSNLKSAPFLEFCMTLCF